MSAALSQLLESYKVKLEVLHESAHERRFYLKGLSGASAAVAVTAIHLTQKMNLLIVLPDKETAAYFLNDIESALGLDHGDGGMRNVLFFPRSAKVPYEIETTENSNIAIRTETMEKIRAGRGQNKRFCVVTYPEALSDKVITHEVLENASFHFKVGDTLDLDFLDEWMQEFKFEKTDFIYEPGQYAIRGGIIDIFSFSNEYPCRIELAGDEIESIRSFDPQSQLSISPLAFTTVIPNTSVGVQANQHINFFQYLGCEDTLLWLQDYSGLLQEIDKNFDRALDKFSRISGSVKRGEPKELFLDRQEAIAVIESMRISEFGVQRGICLERTIEFHTEPHPSFNKNFDLLIENLQNHNRQGYSCIITSAQPKQIERMTQIFQDKGRTADFYPLYKDYSAGFVDREFKLLLYTDHQIYERFHRFRLKEGYQKSREAMTIREIMSLQPGDFVVHIDHGIGQFSGLQKINVNGKEQEAIRLTYKGGDTLYVSIHSLHRISKYSGKEGTAPAMDKLGSNAWQNLKRKTKSKVKEIAYDLIQVYAKRKASKGHAFPPDNYLQHELEASFMYEDTPDQLKAVKAVKEDMEGEAPMDRLVCGDVGFGKTEIAIRAAFKAASDGKQVAILVPTTILSLQHYKTFRDRLKPFAVTVDYLNRFKSAKQKTETIKLLAEGKIDVIVGTHSIVAEKVKFNSLGLLIIDEEQKFGVAVKDKLKKFRANIDTLTLTATPIPRTLQFSMLGARDLSIIQTPPPNRQPIQTEIHGFSEEIIRDAIRYEIQRGGQTFFVHNRVQNIQEVAGMVVRLCPDARVAIAHGQMTGEKLEEIMTSFIEGAYDVLVSTAIVESGIDVSSANTILINDAHHFGMSDLHQLRGRVGRNNKKAFCYLICPPLHTLTDEARKRLTAVEQFSDLGSGLQIAMRDLDIRGAGNLLGGEQSGFINDIGFETYQKILDEAIAELKQEHFADLYAEEQRKSDRFVDDTVLETDFEILIPDDYISQIAERIAVYRQLDEISNDESLTIIRKELTDRFGPIPPATESLFLAIQLRWKAARLGMEKLILKSGKMIGYFQSRPDSHFYQSQEFTDIIEQVKRNHGSIKMYEKDGVLRISFNKVESIDDALHQLSSLSRTNSPLV